MPTGYTAGIAGGKIASFKEFAMVCTRAFLIQYREGSFDSEYEERTPSDYHTKNIKEQEEKLEKLKSISDEDIVAQEKARLEENISYYENTIQEKKEGKEKIEVILKEAKNYKPPTENHQGIADFMVEQLESTLDFDYSGDYLETSLEDAKLLLENIDANSIRQELIKDAEKSLAYHKEEYEKEVERCNSSNEWYQKFVNSLT